ncbi:MAG: Hsp70 family protein [Planctomycetes bacterium]|nr:Hsp70 family protein [Planctomycetota bacterium]
MANSRFLIGIDLGTTNCALAYIDSQKEGGTAEILNLPQIVQPGVYEDRKLLPSFLYLPQKGEFQSGSLKLPWGEEKPYVVGEFAKAHGALVPTHLVSSAKSWLCHSTVNRRDKILPWKATDDSNKVSPLETSTLFLKHLVDSWNSNFQIIDNELRLEKQEIVLTVPASFDADARDFTMEAAKDAGFKKVSLLEEPQAAFYSWLEANKDTWREQVQEGDVILVIDVGGGTSDFTLIAVESDQGNLFLNRLAVGEHILLGGDNMDLALAYELSRQLATKNIKLDLAQMVGLSHACRTAKEKLLADTSIKSWPITILGRGSKMISGTIKCELERSLLEKVLLEGFFPICDKDAQPSAQTGYGFQEIGLPYAADAAITKHLANFLVKHQKAIEQKSSQRKDSKNSSNVNVVLFNGGVFKSHLLRQRILDNLESWGKTQIKMLAHQDLDLSVAIGAASFGIAKRGKGIRIRGGAPRTYYIGIESAAPAIPGFPRPIKALCVVPFGMEEGTESDIPGHEFGLVIGQKVTFRFLSSSIRKNDSLGTILEEWDDEVHEISPLQLTLENPEKNATIVPVYLHSKITDIGTLELWCNAKNTKHKWKLEFNVRENKPKL